MSLIVKLLNLGLVSMQSLQICKMTYSLLIYGEADRYLVNTVIEFPCNSIFFAQLIDKLNRILKQNLS